MGEKSKKRGEFGEEVVSKLLKIVGWDGYLTGREIECYNPSAHRLSNRDRKDHGVDFIYKYYCPLFSNTQMFTLISSKINDKYPSNPTNKFKSHLRDIAYAVECFRKSNLRSKLKMRNASYRQKTSGVIFWLDNESEYDDVISRLSDFKIDENLDFDTIYLVDNKRAYFLFDAMKFAKNHFKNAEIEFFHPNTGYNSTAKQRITSSNTLPVQYLNSSILPVKVICKDEDFLLLYCIDNFEAEYLRKLISLAQKLTENWGRKVYILFPEYNKDRYGEKTDDIKLEFADQRFINKITVTSYKPNFRNVEL